MLASFSSCLYHMGMMEKAETVMRSIGDFEAAGEVYECMMHFTIYLVCLLLQVPFLLLVQPTGSYEYQVPHTPATQQQ